MEYNNELAARLLEITDELEAVADEMMHTEDGSRHPGVAPWDYNCVYSAIMQLRQAIDDIGL